MTQLEKTAASLKEAKRAGLRYVYDTDAGLTRKRRGKAFTYHTTRGAKIGDAKTVARCQKLAIPPAWEEVWICKFADGHIQATGLDARGRKQYRYHADWRTARDAHKFHNLLAFGEALPTIRKRVDADLRKRGLPRERVIAAVLRLLDRSGLRVGNDEYEHSNHTYGLTTIHKEHVKLHGTSITLDFPAKGGKQFHGDVIAPKAAKVIAACEEVPGYRLFRFLDHDGKPHAIGSSDINEWLHVVTGLPVTAKDFRTWNACALFLHEAMEQTRCAEGKSLHIQPVLKTVAEKLGNTPAILKKSYVHPELIDLYRTGCFVEKKWRGKKHVKAGLSETETLLLRWLQGRYG